MVTEAFLALLATFMVALAPLFFGAAHAKIGKGASWTAASLAVPVALGLAGGLLGFASKSIGAILVFTAASFVASIVVPAMGVNAIAVEVQRERKHEAARARRKATPSQRLAKQSSRDDYDPRDYETPEWESGGIREADQDALEESKYPIQMQELERALEAKEQRERREKAPKRRRRR